MIEDLEMKSQANMNKVVGRWGTPEELKKLRGVFKHEDELLPEGYTQIWIPNDFNIYASCIGYKGIDEEGNCVLVAGWRNPFGNGVCGYLPGDEYKYWCELPAFTEQMKSLREQIRENGAPSKYTYPENSKTPEQMAEEHANIRCPEQGPEFIVWCMCRDDFLAGYQAGCTATQTQLAVGEEVISELLAKPQWISVKERLPEGGKVVLVAMPKGTVTLGGIHKKTQTFNVFLDMAIWTVQPTHWMPLPEASKGEK